MTFAASISECNRVVLPDDVGQLKSLIAQRDATIETLTAALESLKQQFLSLRRAQFGVSSERIAGQGELFSEPVSLPVPPVQTETITYERERRRRPALPKDLPRVRVEYDLTPVEKSDFETLTRIGEDKSETLDYIPARLQVIEHVRAKYAGTRKLDGSQTVVSASMPPAPLPKSNASPNLLSHVLVSKYADHLPLNRIEGIFRRHGVELARSTLCDWVLGSTELLSVIYAAMKTHVLSARRFTPTIRSCRFRIGGGAAPCRPGCGLISGPAPDSTIAPSGSSIQRRCSTSSPTIGAASTCSACSPPTGAICKPMLTRVSTPCIKMAVSWRWVAGRTPGASSSTSPKPLPRTPAALPTRPWTGSAGSTRSSAPSPMSRRTKKRTLRQAQSAPVLGEF